MKIRNFAILAMLLAGLNANAEQVGAVQHTGPYKIVSPVVLDSVDCAQTKYKADTLIDAPLQLSIADKAAPADLAALTFEQGSLNMLKFAVTNECYLDAVNVKVEGANIAGFMKVANAMMGQGYV